MEAAADAAEAREGSQLAAWALILVGCALIVAAALAGIVFALLAILVSGAALFLAHTRGWTTPRVAAGAVLVLAILMLLFQGVGGFLGDEDIFQG